MRLRDLVDESVVKVPLESLDKEECFEELVDLLVRAGKIPNRQAALQAIMQRESRGTTGIGQGVGIPHGKDASVPSLATAIGVSPDGIEFDAVDGKPVHVVFLLLARVDDPGPHLRALAEIARLIETPGVPRALAAATSAEQLLATLDGEE